jgi:hypothetical protein
MQKLYQIYDKMISGMIVNKIPDQFIPDQTDFIDYEIKSKQKLIVFDGMNKKQIELKRKNNNFNNEINFIIDYIEFNQLI